MESPEETLEKEHVIIMIQTRLSPLSQKVNLKRKYEEETQLEDEEMDVMRVKRQKQGMTGNERKNSTRSPKASGRQVGRKMLGVRRRIE